MQLTDEALCMKRAHRITWSRCTNSYLTIRWFWRVLVVIALIGLEPAAECLAFTVNQTTLTFESIQGETPQQHKLSVSRSRTNQVTLTASSNTSWLIVSPNKQSMTTSGEVTVAVNTTGLTASTYTGMITVKVGKGQKTVYVTLKIQAPPSAGTVTLAWNAVTDPSLGGYKVYVGTQSGVYEKSISVGKLTGYTVDGLTTRTTYYFAVTAYNSGGESPTSNEVSQTVY